MRVIAHMGGLGHVCQHVHGFAEGTIRQPQPDAARLFGVGRTERNVRFPMAIQGYLKIIFINLQGLFIILQGFVKTERVIAVAQPPASGIRLRIIIPTVNF